MPILDAHAFEFFSRSPEQTRRLGIRLGVLLQAGDLVCLQGELGAGKTTLVQGIAQGWGALDAVSSPTFVLVNAYRRPNSGQLFHFDAYRVESLGEAEELDMDALLSQGPLVVEWAERVKPKNTAPCVFRHVAIVTKPCWSPSGRLFMEWLDAASN
jgi:tRNA threonylcarbamoyladenosine biosynthesis protein TsaE